MHLGIWWANKIDLMLWVIKVYCTNWLSSPHPPTLTLIDTSYGHQCYASYCCGCPWRSLWLLFMLNVDNRLILELPRRHFHEAWPLLLSLSHSLPPQTSSSQSPSHSFFCLLSEAVVVVMINIDNRHPPNETESEGFCLPTHTQLG